MNLCILCQISLKIVDIYEYGYITFIYVTSSSGIPSIINQFMVWGCYQALLLGVPLRSVSIPWNSKGSLIARFIEPTWGSSGADSIQVGPCWSYELCYLGSYCCDVTVIVCATVQCSLQMSALLQTLLVFMSEYLKHFSMGNMECLNKKRKVVLYPSLHVDMQFQFRFNSVKYGHASSVKYIYCKKNLQVREKPGIHEIIYSTYGIPSVYWEIWAHQIRETAPWWAVSYIHFYL